MNTLVDLLFMIDVLTLTILLVGSLWSVASPAKRIWPPPGKRSWQYYLTWACFYLVFGLNTGLIILDWNSWIFDNEIRWLLGVPVSLVGALLVTWGISTLGSTNTSGVKNRFITTGPYRFTRNPQYLGDSILFIGLSIITNSAYLWIAHLLLSLVFFITPITEELWLEEQYGEAYLEYKRNTPRFV